MGKQMLSRCIIHVETIEEELLNNMINTGHVNSSSNTVSTLIQAEVYTIYQLLRFSKHFVCSIVANFRMTSLFLYPPRFEMINRVLI